MEPFEVVATSTAAWWRTASRSLTLNQRDFRSEAFLWVRKNRAEFKPADDLSEWVAHSVAIVHETGHIIQPGDIVVRGGNGQPVYVVRAVSPVDSVSAPPRGPGRPQRDRSGKQQTVSVCLSPAEIEFLQQMGGNINNGLRQLVTQAMAPNNQPQVKK